MYIKCVVFYKELSFMKVDQQKAFKFTSLLSEVGGFLGLLLGASVLTVCEVIDYISLKFTRRCRYRDYKKPLHVGMNEFTQRTFMGTAMDPVTTNPSLLVRIKGKLPSLNNNSNLFRV